MENNLALNVILSFCLLLIGLMFLEGIWNKKGTVIRTGLNVDKLFFPDIKDRKLFKAGDKVAFILCAMMSLLTLINGLLIAISDSVPNISAVFVFIAVVLSWPIRIAFIHFMRKRTCSGLPIVWPFRKK